MSLFRDSFDTSPYIFRGSQLREIGFPLGGIGAGCVSLDGRGGLRDWEIYNSPNKNTMLEHTFPVLWWQEEGADSHAVLALGPRQKEWFGESGDFWGWGHGRFFTQMDGLPCMDECEFLGTFPIARVKFKRRAMPLELELCAFNPFIPLDERSSGFPGACLVYRLKNTSKKKIKATLAWNMRNPVGEPKPNQNREDGSFRGEFRDEKGIRGVHFTSQAPEDDPYQGDASLTTTWPNVTCVPQWNEGEWWDPFQTFWNTFRPTGSLEGYPAKETRQRTPGSLGALVELAPGEEVEIPFFISWRFPRAYQYRKGPETPDAHHWTPWHALEWGSSFDSAAEFFSRYQELSSRTKACQEALFDSTLDPAVTQSVSATLSVLHSPTVIRLSDGTFWAWEGCSPHEGCCEGTCTHVWNYSVAHAWLFPAIQHSMRRADYKNNFSCGPLGKEGAMIFRLKIPLGSENPLWHAASDGQLGCVVQLYRDWIISGDEEYLKELWPSAKRALGFAWFQWDRDRDGLVDGDQHNTYDINFQGPNPLTQFFYLAALRAGEEMARHLGDTAAADEYRSLYESGSKLTEQRLWNGEYFIQEDPNTSPEAPKYQHGHGCLSDQLFGQLCASLAGLGHLVDPAKVRGALRAIRRHNFKNPLGDHENMQRVYAMPDESGLILCSWPKGGRPVFPFPYSDEVWTGIEYHVASHFALEGMEKEAVDIARAIRERHDGRRRNPWNEFECGSHYARAMSSYGLHLALTGFKYSAVEGRAELGKDGRFFFCTPHGWGTASKKGSSTSFDVKEGALFPRKVTSS